MRITPLEGSTFGAAVHGLGELLSERRALPEQLVEQLRQAWYEHGGLLVFKDLPPDPGAPWHGLCSALSFPAERCVVLVVVGGAD